MQKNRQKKRQVLGCASIPGTGTYEKRGRHWAVTDAAGRLVCLAVYKKGAQEVLRRLSIATPRKKRRSRRQR